MTKEEGQDNQNDQKKRTDNTMTKRKTKRTRQYNDQKKKTDNTMTKRMTKNRRQRRRQTIQ